MDYQMPGILWYLEKTIHWRTSVDDARPKSTISRAPHRNRKHTAIRPFCTGTRTVPFGLVAHYLTAITNTDVYRIDPFNLLP